MEKYIAFALVVRAVIENRHIWRAGAVIIAIVATWRLPEIINAIAR